MAVRLANAICPSSTAWMSCSCWISCTAGEAVQTVGLQDCADGNLNSSLDEYCFQPKLELCGARIDAAALSQIADRASEDLTLPDLHYTARTTDGDFAR